MKKILTSLPFPLVSSSNMDLNVKTINNKAAAEMIWFWSSLLFFLLFLLLLLLLSLPDFFLDANALNTSFLDFDSLSFVLVLSLLIPLVDDSFLSFRLPAVVDDDDDFLFFGKKFKNPIIF